MNIDKVFGQPKKLEPWQLERQEFLRGILHNLAQTIVDKVPNTPDRHDALETLARVKLLCEGAIATGRSLVTPDVVHKLMEPVEARDVLVTRLWFNAVDFADVRKFCREDLDVESFAVNLRQGIQGKIYNAQVRISRKIPVGFALAIGEDQGDADLAPDWVPDPAALLRL